MSIEAIKEKTSVSDWLLEKAKRLLIQADRLPEGDAERVRLETEAQSLVDEASTLTEEAEVQAKRMK